MEVEETIDWPGLVKALHGELNKLEKRVRPPFPFLEGLLSFVYDEVWAIVDYGIMCDTPKEKCCERRIHPKKWTVPGRRGRISSRLFWKFCLEPVAQGQTTFWEGAGIEWEQDKDWRNQKWFRSMTKSRLLLGQFKMLSSLQLVLLRWMVGCDVIYCLYNFLHLQYIVP